MEKAGKIKIIVDKKKGADGREFFAAGIRGKYIPKDLAKALGAEEERYYAIRPVGVSLPQKKGVWSVSFSDCWIDKRKPEFQIIRLRDPSFDFEKPGDFRSLASITGEDGVATPGIVVYGNHRFLVIKK